MNRDFQKENKTRIAWVDILRFLGMCLIYWGHLGPNDNVVLYIFAHHVPLFFFISGFFSGKREEASFFSFLWRKVRKILIPYLVFTLLFYALQFANGSLSLSALPSALLVSAKGVRNEAPGPLWFFTCLFVVCIFYELIRRLAALLVKEERAKRALVMGVAAALYLIGIICLGHEPAQDPRWIFNVDSAFVYILYYALGALFFPVIQRWNFSERNAAQKIRFFVFFALSVCFGLFLLFFGAEATSAVSASLGTVFESRVFADALFELYGLFCAAALIFMELCFARMLSRIPVIGRFLAFIGKDSLYHCGNELIIKFFGGLLIAALNLNAALKSDLFTLAYSLLCLIVLSFTLNLFERLLFGRLFLDGTVSNRR